MIFRYREFLGELKESEDTRNILEEYEEYVGPIGQKPIENIIDEDGAEIRGSGETWYRELVRPFPKLKDYEVPQELIGDFDWGMLSQLVASSLSSKVDLIASKDEESNQINIRVKIQVESGEKYIEKFMDKLWGFQVRRLLEIYIKENIQNCINCHKRATEREAIYRSKRKELEYWKRQLKLMEFLKSSPSTR